LGSAFDDRVKSVTAMSGWVNIQKSFLGNSETIKVEAMYILKLAAKLFGKPSSDLNQMMKDYSANKNLDFLT